MQNVSIDLFVHGSGRPQLVAAELGEVLRDVLARHHALPENEVFVFVGESEDALVEVDDDEDHHEPVDINLTVEALELHKHRHVHIHAAKRIEVTVYFNGQHSRRFSPATTVATVTQWAKNRFHIDPAGGDDLVLQLRPDGVEPRQDQHLGELVALGQHTLVFDLVREITPQG